MNVTVLGMGYIGCVTGACLADMGHNVTGADRDDHKVGSILDGEAPFYEPGLQELVRQNVAAGRLSATTSTPDAIRNSDVVLVCVGTPSEKNGNLGLDQLRRVVADIAACAGDLSKPTVVAIRSTVFPGTCEEVVLPALRDFPNIRVVSNPEFLREGVAVKDFFEPSLVVVGGNDRPSVEKVAALYAPLSVTPCLVSLRTAEMIKYTCNAFHAVKISFANEIGALCSRLGIDAHEVMSTLCEDVKLNISATYLKPGFAFGGSCLPKDLRALVYRAARLDLKLPLLESAMPSNREHLQRAVDAILDRPPCRIGVIGLAFKEDTDDLRESPVVSLLEQLIGKGRDVRIFDPHIQLDSIYGANRSFVLDVIPHIGRLLERSLEDVLNWAECVVIAQKQAPGAMDRILASGLAVIDLSSAKPAAAVPVAS
jgi:GDP-mannose 6-dehydrogenase